ncbi:hypothetical protein C357_20460 [Citreicella sp. 357]|nr:hypothetical protein C357_20460 [Citreicella sp. 357]
MDLSGWIENGLAGSSGAGTWSVQSPDRDSALQTRNGSPPVFFDPVANDLGKVPLGSIAVETARDDDFVGFVLGYDNGDLDSAAADF